MRLRTALERGVELLAEAQIEDQERRLALLRLLGSGHVPAGVGRRVRQRVGERRVAGDHDQAVAAAGRERLGIGRPVPAGSVRRSRSSRGRPCARPAGGDRPDGDRRRAPARLAEALLVERARHVQARRRRRRGPSARTGPSGSRRPRRQMRSISSSGATRSSSSLSASRPNGRLQRLTRKPGPSAATITCLPIASPVARASASAASEDCSPATTSSRRITGGGLKKCMPTTRSGRLAARGDRGHEQRRGVGGEHAVLGDDLLGQPREQLALDLQALGRGLDHELARRRSPRAPARPRAAPTPPRPRDALRRPRSTPRSSWARIRSRPRSSASRSPGRAAASARPDRHASWAIPAPIVPAPATPMVPAGPGGRAPGVTQERAR